MEACVILHSDVFLGEEGRDILEEEIDDACENLGREWVVDDDIVDTIEELGSEKSFEFVHNPLREFRFVSRRLDEPTSDIGRHNDDRIFETHRSSLAIRESSVVEYLQEYIEYIAMRLLDLIEEDHRIRFATHELGELSAFLMSDISRRRSDESCN